MANKMTAEELTTALEKASDREMEVPYWQEGNGGERTLLIDGNCINLECAKAFVEYLESNRQVGESFE